MDPVAPLPRCFLTAAGMTIPGEKVSRYAVTVEDGAIYLEAPEA